MVKSGDEYHFIQAWPATPVDATGAGDTYAAGFLYAHSLGMPLKVCGEVGSIIAAKVGGDAGTMFYSSIRDPHKLVLADDIFDGEADISPDARSRILGQSTAKNAITSKSIITYLKDHAEQIKQDDAAIQSVQKKLAVYISLLDMSSILMFSQSLVNTETPVGTSLYDYFYDVFDDEILDLLMRNNMNEAMLRGDL